MTYETPIFDDLKGSEEDLAGIAPEPGGDPIRVVCDKSESILPESLRPHYTDKRFSGNKLLTVFLSPDCKLKTEFGNEAVNGCHYKYSNDPALKGAFAVAEQVIGDNSTAAYYEEALRCALDDDTVDICHILAGVGDDGIDYQVLGYFLREL